MATHQDLVLQWVHNILTNVHTTELSGHDLSRLDVLLLS